VQCSATSTDADSASAYFSVSDFFELIIWIVLWRHAMCSISQALCCRQGEEDPFWWCSNALEGKACFNVSAFIHRRSRVCCLQHIALIRRILTVLSTDYGSWTLTWEQVNLKKNSKAHTSIMPRGAFLISMDLTDAINEIYQIVSDQAGEILSKHGMQTCCSRYAYWPRAKRWALLDWIGRRCHRRDWSHGYSFAPRY